MRIFILNLDKGKKKNTICPKNKVFICNKNT